MSEREFVRALIATCVCMAIFALVPRLITDMIGNDYLFDFVKQIIFAVPVFISVIILKKVWIYRPNPRALKKEWTSALVFIFILLFNLVQCFTVTIEISPASFLFFWGHMLLIGYCEEVLYRGLILNALHKTFGENTLWGTRLAVILSGAIFGAFHLLNATHPEVRFSSAVVQAAGAGFLGMYLGAVYIRTGKALWFLVILHALNDGLVFIASGLMSGNSAASIVDQMGGPYQGAAVLVYAVFYGGLTCFLLRKKKLR